MPTPGQTGTYSRRQGTRDMGDTMTICGVECRRHNTRPRTGLTELQRASAMAECLDECCRLTTGQQKALYLRLRKLWAEIESDRRKLEARALEHRSWVEPPLFGTGGKPPTGPRPGNA